MTSTDLGTAVRHSLSAAEPRARAARVRINAEIASLPMANADPDRFSQVVDNLLSNAIKYTPSGGTVDVCLSQYTKFFRARTARERAIAGVGLAMVITKTIVEGHGGSIEVHSEEGVGTTMRVRLPLDRVEPDHAGRGVRGVSAATPGHG